MSDLQIVLIVLGFFIIAGVVIYNWMQEKKLRENITDDFIVPQKDVLVEEFYIDTDALVEKEFANDAHKEQIINKLNSQEKAEPEISENLSEVLLSEDKMDRVLPNDNIAREDTEVKTNNLTSIEDDKEEQTPTESKKNVIEDELVVKKNILPAEFEPLATSSLPDQVHSQIDLTAFLYATKNINGHAFYKNMKNMLKDVNVLIMFHGLDKNDIWQLIDDATAENDAFKQIACSMQLADRRGPVPKPILNKFQYAIETIGLEFNAHVEWQGKGDPAIRAVDLDKFCMDVDQLVSVHLIQGDTQIHGTKFKGLAESNGLKLKHGKFCYFDRVKPDFAKFVLVSADGQPFTEDSLRQKIVIGATFQIEIPKVINCEDLFAQMVGIAKQMAVSLDAHIVDDNQKPLGDLQIEKIRQQLKIIHAKMVARGVMPGSSSSMRLFE
jgi:FtsZ-interacting cell division protein ZipA